MFDDANIIINSEIAKFLSQKIRESILFCKL